MIKYPSNELDGFASGAMLDLRVRFAMNLLQHSPMFQGAFAEYGSAGATDEQDAALPKEVATIALDTATELLDLAEKRGLVEQFNDYDTEPTDRMRAQAKRVAAWQVLQQLEAQRFAQNEQTGISRVMPMAPGFKQ